MNIVFFGTSEFGIPILEKLIASEMKPSLVVTTPDMPAGRRLQITVPPIKGAAKSNGIPVFQPERLDDSAVSKIGKADLFIVGAYGKILPKSLLDIPEKGTINVHPSLLPKYRGPSPVQSFLLDGANETGVTIMLMDEEIDHGPILAKEAYSIKGHPTQKELKEILAGIGADLLVSTIVKWQKGEIEPQPQAHSEATHTRIFKKEDGKIDWNASAQHIERQVRAFSPWPGAFTSNGKRIKILKAEVLQEKGEAGKTFKTRKGKLGVYAKTDALVIEQLQTEGGKPMNSKEFLLGNKDIIGITFT